MAPLLLAGVIAAGVVATGGAAGSGAFDTLTFLADRSIGGSSGFLPMFASLCAQKILRSSHRGAVDIRVRLPAVAPPVGNYASPEVECQPKAGRHSGRGCPL